MADDEVSAPHGQPLMPSAARYAGREPLRLASVVFWNVTEAGMRLRLAAWARRPPGATDEAPTGRYTCDVGVIAVGNRRVFRLRLGQAPMVGASPGEATLPAELLARFPLEFFADQVAAIRPLSVAVDGDRLYIRALGPGQLDLAVRTLDGSGGDLALGAEAIAAEVRALTTWPAPEDAIATIVTAPSGELDPTLERALADRDYAQALVDLYERQAPDVRRALIHAAHAGPRVLHDLIDRGMRAGAPPLRTIVFTAAFCAVLIIGGTAATVMLGAGLLPGSHDTLGRIVAPGSGKFGVIAAMSVFGFASIAAGVALVVRGWRYVDARSTERRMLAQGGGQGGEFGSRLGGQRDGLLALAALRGPGLTPSEWRDIEAAATSDPAFADRLCAGLLAVPAANRAVFLGAAPAGLKQFLVGSLRARKSPARSPAAFAFVAAWLACLAAGVVGGAVEAPQASLSTTDWLLLLAGAGALPAIMLAVAQATHRVRGRRLARLP